MREEDVKAGLVVFKEPYIDADKPNVKDASEKFIVVEWSGDSNENRSGFILIPLKIGSFGEIERFPYWEYYWLTEREAILSALKSTRQKHNERIAKSSLVTEMLNDLERKFQ